MKIMQVIPVLDLAGAETMCQNLAIELHKMGHEVMVVSLYKKETVLTENLRNESIPVIWLDKKNGLDPSCIFRLYRLIRQFNPDVVHSHIYAGKYAHIAAMMAGVKNKVYTVHNVAQKEATDSNKRMNKVLFKKLGVVPVALTQEIQKSIEDVYGIDESKIPVVFNGIPLEKCKPIQVYKKNATEIVHVGRFFEAKNHRNLIYAFADVHTEFPEIHLKLYGDGPLRNDMETLVSELQIDNYIHFMGLTNDVYSVMSEADVFILPSIYEGMPMTLIEAMATGLPIITTPVGGIVDMLEDGSEAIFTGTDSDSIADSICRLVDNGELRQSLGHAALKRSKQFSAGAMAEKYTELYGRNMR